MLLIEVSRFPATAFHRVPLDKCCSFGDSSSEAKFTPDRKTKETKVLHDPNNSKDPV